MKNRYPGKCSICGSYIPAQAGIVEKIQGVWVLYHNPGDCPEITSGLGIGGVGSDDYNINSELQANFQTHKPQRNGGGQLWEPCPRCGQEPVHLDCGYCDKHCKC